MILRFLPRQLGTSIESNTDHNVRKTLSTVADGREPLGKRIAGMLMLLAVISMLTGLGLCVTGRMSGIALFLGGPLIAVVAFAINGITDIVSIRRAYRTDVERIGVLRRSLDRGDAVPVELLLDESQWTLRDLRRPLAYLLLRGEVQVHSDTEGRSAITRRQVPEAAPGAAETGSAAGSGGVDAVLHADGGGLILPSIEGLLVADERWRWRVAARSGQVLGLLTMTLGVPEALAGLSGPGFPFIFETGFVVFVLGVILSLRYPAVPSRMLRQIQTEHDRIVYELLRSRETMTVGAVREEIGWPREELDDVLMRLVRRRLILVKGGFADTDEVRIGIGRAG